MAYEKKFEHRRIPGAQKIKWSVEAILFYLHL